MNKTIRYLAVLPMIIAVACNYTMSYSGSASDISDPIFPRTPSIIPLQKGNAWVFSTTWYDSLGKKKYPNRVDFHLAIPGQYGMSGDTTLVVLDRNNAGTKFKNYAYKYEMEEQGSGYLIAYRDLYPLEVRGLYILGEYDDTVTRLYPKEQFWLAYPADSGKTWQYHPDPLHDSSRVNTMELLSNHATFAMLAGKEMTGVSFSDSCYLYKEIKADTVAYYYYDKNIGNLGYLQYFQGKIRKSLILKSFSNTNQTLPD